MASNAQDVAEFVDRHYEAGFVTDIESDTVAPGLDEATIRLISAKKDEPEWMLEWRLKAFARWQTMREPKWAHVHYPPIDFQAISYYAAPKSIPNCWRPTKSSASRLKSRRCWLVLPLMSCLTACQCTPRFAPSWLRRV